MTSPAAEQLESEGFTALEGLWDVEFIDALRKEYQRQYPDVAAAADAYLVDKRRVQVTMQLKGPFLSPQLYAHPEVLALARSALGDDILIDNFSLVTALPGAPAQNLHVDHPDLFPEHPFARAAIRPYALNVSIPLVDLTPETGTTRLFSVSHRRIPEGGESHLPYIARGGCYVADYRLRHHGTENGSPAERPILYLMFARPWFTDITNYGDNVRIRIAAEDLKTVPPEHRPLFRRLAAKGAFDRTVSELFAT